MLSSAPCDSPSLTEPVHHLGPFSFRLVLIMTRALWLMQAVCSGGLNTASFLEANPQVAVDTDTANWLVSPSVLAHAPPCYPALARPGPHSYSPFC